MSQNTDSDDSDEIRDHFRSIMDRRNDMNLTSGSVSIPSSERERDEREDFEDERDPLAIENGAKDDQGEIIAETGQDKKVSSPKRNFSDRGMIGNYILLHRIATRIHPPVDAQLVLLSGRGDELPQADGGCLAVGVRGVAALDHGEVDDDGAAFSIR